MIGEFGSLNVHTHTSHTRPTTAYLGAIEARQQPLVGGAVVVNFPNLGQPMQMHVHGEVVGSAQTSDDDLVMQVTLAVYRNPGMA